MNHEPINKSELNIVRKRARNKFDNSLVFLSVFTGVTSYVASYAPIATPVKTNKNLAQYWTIIYFQLPYLTQLLEI